MNSKFLLITLILITFASTKFLPHTHLQDSQPSNSTTPPTSTTSTNDQYLQALQNRQAQLKQALAILNNQTQHLHNTLQKLQGLPQIQIVALEDALADQLNILSDLASDHKLPLQNQSSYCTNISEGDIAVLQASMTQIEHDLSQINAQIQEIKAEDTENQSQELVKQLQLQAEWVQNYLSKLKEVVSALKQCPDQTTQPSQQQSASQQQPSILYVSNPDAVNWIYGSLSASQYYTRMLSYISDNKNGTCQIGICPIGTPFVIQQSKDTDNACSQCPDDLPLFDVSLNQCVVCPTEDGYVFVQDQHMCIQSQSDQQNVTSEAPIVCEQHPQLVFNPSTNECECPEQSQFFNGQSCIVCQLPSFWSTEQNQCQQCPTTASYFYNTSTQKCEECPVQKPLSTGLGCSACALNEFFDKATLKCQTCQGNKFYNPIHDQCQCRQDQPFFNGTLCSPCPAYQQFSQNQQCTQCLSDKEFYNTTSGECQQCPIETPVGNMDFCLGCPEDTIFDEELWVCQPCNGQGMKLVELDGEKKCTCPPSAPFLDKSQNQCVSCYLPNFWNQTTNKCESCPPDMVYSREAQQCTICPVSAPLIIDGRCNPCPSGKHFNFTTGTCTTCPGSMLYFEKASTCIIPNCEEGAEWNEQRLECLSICKGESLYSPQSQTCICPPEIPYYNNESCVSCYLPQHWDTQKLVCTDCEDEEQYFNLDLQQCIFCGYHEKFNVERYRCEPICDLPSFYNETINECQNCPQGMVYSPEDKVCGRCPIGAQLIVQGRCFACPNQTHFDSTLNKCLACPEDTFYNANLKICASKCKGQAYYNTTSNRCTCPIDIPFYDGQSCRECYFPKYWQIQTQSCQYCPPEQYFNTDQGKCTPCEQGYQLIFLNDSVKCEFIVPECPYPMYYDLEHKACANCAQDTVYSLLEQKCVSCPADRPLIINNTCEYCPSETHYDSVNKKCIRCREGKQVFSAELSQCVLQCNGESIYDVKTKKCVCPAYRPFYDGTHCMSCYLPKYWDIITHSCQYCPTEQYFSVVQQKCVYCDQGYFLSKQTYKCIKETPICTFPQFLNPQTLECQQCDDQNGEVFDFYNTKQCIKCPSDKPLIINYQCQACGEGTFYDQEKKVCMRCKEGTSYLRESKSCEPICTAESQIYNPSNKQCECVEKYEYLNPKTKTCVKCELPKYWDYLQNTCRVCAEQNSYFNETLQKCVSCPYRYKFDLSSYTCVIDQTQCLYDRQQYFNYTLQKCVCPSEKPYFTSSHICVACGVGAKKLYEYWDEKNQKCISCSLGMHYEPSQGMCALCPQGQIFNTITGKCDLTCPQQAIFNKETQSCECRKEGYHWKGDHCAHCAQQKGQFWLQELKSCTKCPSGSYFSQQFKKCAQCPSGYKYDEGKQLCVKEVIVNTCSKYSPRIWYNPDKKTCQCPKDTPYYSGISQTCVKCQEDYNTYWDMEQQRCVECNSYQYYDLTSKKCSTCAIGYRYSAQQSKCVWSGVIKVGTKNVCNSSELTFNSVTKKCECKDARLPFFDGQKCVSCSLPKFWNPAVSKCEECSEGMHYDTIQKACITCKSDEQFNFDNYKCEPTGKVITVDPINVKPTPITVKPTPITEVDPVSVNPTSQVRPITIPTQVDPFAVTPTTRPTTTTTITPTPTTTTTITPTPISIKPTPTTVITPTPISIKPTPTTVIPTPTTAPISIEPTQCPSSAPYWDKNSGKCIACYLPKYWNHDSQACESCPLNKNYDIAEKKCVTCWTGYKFDFTKYRCVQTTPTSMEVDPVVTEPTTSPVVISGDNCPNSSPFWDGQRCVSCYLPRYWNTRDLKCEDCEQGKSYDIGIKKCIVCANRYNSSTFRCE